MTKIQVRRGTAALWSSTDPLLALGEPAFETDTGKVKYGDGSSAWSVLPYLDAPDLAAIAAETARALLAEGMIVPDIVAAFSITGVISITTGTRFWYNDTGNNQVIKKVRASVVTPPTGAALIIDVNLGGTTIFTTQANRPTIAIGGITATGVPDVTTWPDGAYLSVDVDQVGSTVQGSDLTVLVTT